MIVYLLPKSPFTKSAPRSDTLFGAICWAIRLLYGQQKLVDIIEKFDAAIESARPLPFLLTSCFPYFQDKQGKIHFLPKPLLPLDCKTTSTTAELTPSSKLKKLKKA
ncbi:MAG: hypothetical protein JNN15_08080, partial [Blastocatellia bacterium]|nr:hypothetical protein [Blastocatellia bacterium]